MKAPNASGKTSLVKALKIVTCGNLKEKELIGILNEHETSGSVELSLNDNKYTIRLIRSGEKIRVFGSPFLIDPMDSSKAVESAFLDLESSLFRFITTGDRESLNRWLEGITDIIELERILRVAEHIEREYIYAWEAEKRKVSTQQEELKKVERDLVEKLEKIEKEIEAILGDPDYMDYLRIKHEFDERYEELETRREELRKERIEKKRELEKAKLNLDDLRFRLERLRTRKSQLERELKTLKDKKKVSAEKLISYEKTLEDLKAKIRDIDKQLNGYVQSTERGVVKIPGVRDRLAELRERLKKRSTQKDKMRCDWCGLPIQEEVSCPKCGYKFNFAEKIVDELYEIQKEVDTLEALENQLIEEKISYQKEMDRIREEIRRIKVILERELNEKQTELSKTISDINKVERELKEVDRQIEKLSSELEDIESEISECDSEEFTIDQELKRTLTERISPEKVQQYEQLHSTYRTLEEKKASYEDQLILIRTRIAEVERRAEKLQILERRAEIARKITSFFRRRIEDIRIQRKNLINEMLRKNFTLLELAEFDRIELTDEGLELIRKGASIPTDLGSLSDAEKALISIIIAHITKQIVIPDFPFFVIDTIAELMDDTRIERIIKELDEKARETGEIIVVSKLVPLEGPRKLLSQENIARLSA